MNSIVNPTFKGTLRLRGVSTSPLQSIKTRFTPMPFLNVHSPPPNPNVRTTRMQAQVARADGLGIKQRILIVGGVAGGASAAARSRRLSEAAEIVMFDKGPYVSFANCGLPYYVGNVIAEEKKLLVATAELFKTRFNIQVKVRHEVTSINRAEKTITVKDLETGSEQKEKYDKLVLSPGAQPIRPPLPGIDLPGIFILRNIPDSRDIKAWIKDRNVKNATVVGGGFIGLEMAENLHELGLHVTIVEGADQVMPPLDYEMAEPMHALLRERNVDLLLGHMVSGFEARGNDILTRTKQGGEVAGGIVILGIGVAPDVALAKAAGLELGGRGIKVNASMQTSDPDIYAVGDAVESIDVVTGQPVVMALAGPANRQGRIAADHISGRASSTFRGVQGTSVVGAFGLAAAATGASEKVLKRCGIPYKYIHLHPIHHAGYYPGATPIFMKLLYSPDDGKILGAQAVGENDAPRKIDVIAMAIQGGLTVFDLEEADLCYAPQFGSAKDAVNMAGFIAANDLRGDAPIINWTDRFAAESDPNAVLVDVREPGEWDKGHEESAINLPLSKLRTDYKSLPKDKVLHVTCQVGQRGHYATRFLRQHGYDAWNVTGGFKSSSIMRQALKNKAAGSKL